MTSILIGNIISLVGCTLMVCIGFIKEKKRILTAQCFQFGILSISNLVLGGNMGFVSNIVSIIRNLVFSRWKSTTALKLLFIAVQLLLSLRASEGGLVGWLPVLATILFTWFIDTKSEVTLKTVIIVSEVFWLVYDLCHLNYVSVCFDAFTMLSNFAGILMLRRPRKK